MNKFIASGNLVREPELTYSQTGTAIFRNALAVNDEYKKDKTHFFNFTAFGKTAETMATYLQKGSKILVDASLNQNTYEKDGQNRTSIELNINRFEFLNSKKQDDSNGSGNNQGSYRGNSNNRTQTSNNGLNDYNSNEDPFLTSGRSIDISDDDMPF